MSLQQNECGYLSLGLELSVECACVAGRYTAGQGICFFERDTIVRIAKRFVDFLMNGERHRVTYLDYFAHKSP